MKTKKIFSIACALLLTFAFTCSCSSQGNNEQARHPKVKAIDFSLPDTEGNMFNLKKMYEKHPVLLYFWATWCPHCQKAPAKLKKLIGRYGSNYLSVVGINVGSGDSYERVKRYKKKKEINYLLLYDKGSRVTRMYNVRGIPLFLLVDKDGYIVYFSHETPENLDKFLKKG